MNRTRFHFLLIALALMATVAVLRADRDVARAESPLTHWVRPEPTIPDFGQTQKIEHRWMEVTAYCPCTRCCGPQASGITASGLPVTHNEGRFVAADTRVLPFGSKLSIPGYHQAVQVPVIDRGGAIKGNKLDVYFPSHSQALEWGRRWVMVSVETSVQ